MANLSSPLIAEKIMDVVGRKIHHNSLLVVYPQFTINKEEYETIFFLSQPSREARTNTSFLLTSNPLIPTSYFTNYLYPS